MASAISKYRTRRSTRQCLPKSRIDRRRTRMASLSQMCDTDEENESSYEESEDEESLSSASEDEQNPANNTTDSSDEEKESSCEKSKDKELKSGTTEDYNDQNPASKTTDSSDEEPVIRKKRLCLSNLLTESESSSDSEIYSKPVRKVKAKSRCIFVQDDESNSEEQPLDTSFSVKIAENAQLEKELAIARKRKRQLELKRLSQKRRSQSTSSTLEVTEISDEESDTSSLSQVENSSETEWENNSLEDFIVSDEKDLQVTASNHNKSLLEKYLPNFHICDLYSHFQRVVKALLINAFDTNFLKSLYEGRRTKKYAKEILKSLNYLDERCVDVRLTNLKSTSRWKDRYKERIDCYPNLHVKEHPGYKTSCQACELKRTCRFTVTLSGKLYDSKNLEQDSFMSSDKQVLLVGRVCSERTEVYHGLKHFKYKLYEECCSIVQSEGTQDENVKDAVNRIHRRLKEQSWIEERYKHFETILADADYFHEENLE